IWLRVPRLLLLRELLVGAQRVSAPGSPVRMDVDHLHTLVSRSKIRLLDAWVVQELGRRSVEGDRPVLQHITVMGHAQYLARVLLGDQDRRARGVDRAYTLENRVEDLGRQAERRLVEEQQPRIAHQRPAEGEHLLFAAGQVRRLESATLAQHREQLVDERKALLDRRSIG